MSRVAGDHPGISGNSEVHAGRKTGWKQQKAAMDQARASHRKWTGSRKSDHKSKAGHSWIRVTFTLKRPAAQEKARAFFEKYPKAAYWTEVESWRELPDDVIEFTMRRLPTAD